MGTTLVIGIARGSNVTMANLGDSRIYGVLESGKLQITGDQNVRGTKLRLHQPQWGPGDGAALVGHLGRFVPGEDSQWIDDHLTQTSSPLIFYPVKDCCFVRME